MLVPAKDLLVGDIIVTDEFFRDTIRHIREIEDGCLKVSFISSTLEMILKPNETVLIARPKTVVLQ